VVLAVLALTDAGDGALAVGARLAALAFVCLVAAVVLGWPALLPFSLLLLSAAYAVHLYIDDVGLDATAVAFGAGLLVTAELGYWSLEEREHVRGDPGEDLRRFGLVALLGLAGLVVGALLLAVADIARTGGLGIDLAGAAAAAAALLVVVLFARRPRD
jgi:hypothetical protein